MTRGDVVSKANAEGWIRHRGGKCPVDAGVAVEYRMRSEMVMTSQTGSLLSWDHLGCGADIMAYRIHKPAEQPAPVNKVVIQAAKPEKFDALAIRDRIRELETRRAEVESTYQRQISEITQERESLVQKLAGEGLALVEVLVRPAEDMSDWRNWRAGDLVEALENSVGYTKGNLYRFIRHSLEYGSVRTLDDKGQENGMLAQNFKWHSRPSP